jgi:hypothetical protein
MELFTWIVTALSIISSILAWLAKIKWSNEFRLSKEAEITSIKEQLKTKDELINLKDSQIQHFKDLNPIKLKEYHDVVQSELEAYNNKLQTKLELKQEELEITDKKLVELEHTNMNDNSVLNLLRNEKELLKEQIDYLKLEITNERERNLKILNEIYRKNL